MFKKIFLTLGLLAILTSCTSQKTNIESADNFDISVVKREDGSGTKKSFIEQMGLIKNGEDGGYIDMTTDDAVVVNSTNNALKAVELDKTAIAYISLASLDDSVKTVKIEGVKPSRESIESGDYKLQRPFSLAYKKDSMTDLSKDFLEFIKSKDAKDLIEGEDLIFLSNDKEYKPKKLKGKLTITGSSSLGSIVDKLSEKYQSLNENVDVEVLSNESLTGLRNVSDRVVDIAMVSNNVEDENLNSEIFAIDGIAIIVNKENDLINDLTIEELRSIYKGDIKNTGELRK